jgi:hypothetical protein
VASEYYLSLSATARLYCRKREIEWLHTDGKQRCRPETGPRASQGREYSGRTIETIPPHAPVPRSCRDTPGTSGAHGSELWCRG